MDMQFVKQTLDKFLQIYTSQEDTLGILGHGSYFDGRYTSVSDIDLIVITVEGKEEKKHFRLDGVLFEVSFYNEKKIRHFLERNAIKNVRMFADSEMLYDKDGRCARMLAVCREKIKHPHPMLKQGDLILGTARELYTQRNRLPSLKQDQGTFEIACGQLLNQLSEYFLLANGQWGHKGIRKVQGNIEEIDASVAALFRRCMVPNEIEDRIAATDELTNLVIDTMGEDLRDKLIIDLN